MPRLQILQHKSYHPYLEKNKQRVRQDEANARQEELDAEQNRIDTEAEQRLAALRRRANSPAFRDEGDLPSTSAALQNDDPVSSLVERRRQDKAREAKREKRQRDRLDFDFPSESSRRRDQARDAADRQDDLDWHTDGHFNLFADVEREKRDQKPELTREELAKKKKDQEKDPFTVYLARPERETQPWYTDKEMRRYEDKEIGDDAEYRRARDKRKDARSKSRNDPLTNINTLLSSQPKHHHPRSKPLPPSSDPSAARKAREQTERERAMALVARSKQPPRGAWDDTPSTVSGGGNWADDFERAKNRAGMRFYGPR